MTLHFSGSLLVTSEKFQPTASKQLSLVFLCTIDYAPDF